MMDLIHAMRTRIVTSPAFTNRRIIGAILFENTMNRQVAGRGAADYLWHVKGIVPFLKVDKGLADERDGVQLMKPMPGLEDLLAQGKAKGVYGTKMRLRHQAGRWGWHPRHRAAAVRRGQADFGRRPYAHRRARKWTSNARTRPPRKPLLQAEMLAHLDALNDGQVILKLTLPEAGRVLLRLHRPPQGAARGGAFRRLQPRGVQRPALSRQPGMTASFSRALTEGLSAQQSDDAFNAALDASIQSIFASAQSH